MSGLLRKSSKKEVDKEIINFLGDNLKENSKIIEKTLITTKMLSKNLVGPLSKSLDYLVVSILTIVIYNYYNNYMK